MNTLKKRLIGTDDIAFDDSGTGVKDSYVSKDGKEYKVKRLNASDIPVTEERRNQYNGAPDIDTALKRVKEQIDSFKSADFMQSDITIRFGAEETVEDIKNKINSEKKNLGGFTLEFVFPESLNQKLSKRLVFDGFFNGKLIIRGGSETLLSEIYDLADIGSLFEVRNCLCSVEISNFKFMHQFSKYGIYLRGSLYTYIKNCTFTGNGESTGIFFDGSDGKFDNCTFYDDTDMEVTGAVKEAIEKLRSESSEKYLPFSGGEMTGSIRFSADEKMRVNVTSSGDMVLGNFDGTGSRILLRSSKASENPGLVSIMAVSNGKTMNLSCYPDGRAELNGKPIETVQVWGSNYKWYRKYSDGFIIQGGTVSASGNGEQIVTLNTPFSSTGYKVLINYENTDMIAADNYIHYYQCQTWGHSTSSFKHYGISAAGRTWVAFGY